MATFCLICLTSSYVNFTPCFSTLYTGSGTASTVISISQTFTRFSGSTFLSLVLNKPNQATKISQLTLFLSFVSLRDAFQYRVLVRLFPICLVLHTVSPSIFENYNSSMFLLDSRSSRLPLTLSVFVRNILVSLDDLLVRQTNTTFTIRPIVNYVVVHFTGQVSATFFKTFYILLQYLLTVKVANLGVIVLL